MDQHRKAIFDRTFSGQCPQCRMLGLDRPMWMNIEENYECPDCQLLVQLESYAVILLPFRGMGCFQFPKTPDHCAVPDKPATALRTLTRVSDSGSVEYLDSTDKLLDYLESVD